MSSMIFEIDIYDGSKFNVFLNCTLIGGGIFRAVKD